MKFLKTPQRNSFFFRAWCSCFVLAFVSSAYSQRVNDTSLEAVRASDRAGQSSAVSVAEHMRRAAIYLANRAFASAREHWQAVINGYPNDANVPAALFGLARSFYQERRYEEAQQVYDRLA